MTTRSVRSAPLRLGVIGLGSVFEPYSLMMQQLMHEGRLEIAATCDTVESRAHRVTQFLGVEAPFTTRFEAILADETIDAVAILTSMDTHGPIASAALAAGKHVLVEKPMSVDLDEARQLVDRASAPGAPILICAPHVLLSPTYQTMWKRVQQGEIGRVRLARARYGWSGPWWGQWYYRTGGGPLFDLGVYNVTSLTGFLGGVKRVSAFSGTALPERVVDGERIQVEVPDNYQIMLDFGENTFASITTGFTMLAYRGAAIELYGDSGTAQLMGDDWAPAGHEVSITDRNAWSIFAETDPSWHWTSGLRHLVDCVLENTTQLIRPQHAYHCLEVMVKAQRSAETGSALEVESDPGEMAFDIDAIDMGTRKLSHDTRILRKE